MRTQTRNPAAGDGRVPETFCLGAERSEDTRTHCGKQDSAACQRRDVHDVKASLLRDFVYEALEPVERDSAAARLCLGNDDDVGTRYHLKRVVECVKAAASTFRELEDHLLGQPKAAAISDAGERTA
jgi:hypothetical protein